MSYRGAETMAEALHDPNVLPADLPVPQDDGAARHLTGMRLPDIALGRRPTARRCDLSKLGGPHRRLCLSAHRTSRAGAATGWDAIPGARGCTPQSCGFRDHFAELRQLGVTRALRTVDPGHRLSARGGRAAASAVRDLVRRGSGTHPGDAAADLRGRRHDADQAHGLGDRRRRADAGVLPGVSARPERHRVVEWLKSSATDVQMQTRGCASLAHFAPAIACGC